LPAYQRYDSARIAEVRAMADRVAVGFCILSGEFGLIEQSALIPWYDHPLTAEEAPALAQIVAQQISEHGIGEICYYLPREKATAEPDAYRTTLRLACDAAGVALRICALEGTMVYDGPCSWKELTRRAAAAKGLLLADLAAGEAEFERLLRECGHDGMIHFKRGKGYESSGYLDLALIDYRAAERLFPLPRYKQQARDAAERVRGLLAQAVPTPAPAPSGDPLPALKSRMTSVKRFDQALVDRFLRIIERLNDDWACAAVELRKLLERVGKGLLSRVCELPGRDLCADITLLKNRGTVPPLIASYMHTIRVVGDCAAHDNDEALSIADVWMAAMAMAAVLEWLDASESA
jgi:hypothetical protein